MTAAPKGWERATSLSLTEAAAVLGVSRSLAYQWATGPDARLPTMRDHLGDHRVKPAALKRLLREREGRQARLPLRGLGR